MRRARIALAALLLCAACEGRPQGEAAKSGDAQQKKLTGPAVSVVDLSSGVPEVEKASLFGSAGPRKRSSFRTAWSRCATCLPG